MIRFNQVKELIIVDLLQANRQSNDTGRSKKIDKSNLAWRLLLQNGSFLLIYAILFGTIVFNLPLPEFPGLFTQSMSFMALFVLLQIYQLIFNLFYDDANLSEYLSLPFSMGELFLSKLMTIVLNTFAFFLLPFILMGMLGWQAGHSLFLVLPLALISTFIILVVMILVPFVFLHLLHQIPFYLKYKKVFTILIYLALFGFIFFTLYANEPNDSNMMEMLDPVPNPLFVGFHEMFIPGQFYIGGLKVALWGLVAAGLSFIAYQWVIPQLYSEEKQRPTRQRKAKKKTKSVSTLDTHSKWKVFAKYQLRQLQDTTFIIQMIFSKFFLPIIFIGPALIGGGGLDLTFLLEIPNLWGIYLLIGAAFAAMTSGEIAISGVIISFDKENYAYIQSLPISFRQYMQFKFWFSFMGEWVLGLISLVVVALFVKLPGVIFTLILIGFTIGTYIASMYFFMRDYRLLNLNWTNFTELMQRGLNQFVRMLFIFVLVFVGIFSIMGLGFWLLTRNDPMIIFAVSALIAVLLVLSAVGLYVYSNKKFWVNFNE